MTSFALPSLPSYFPCLRDALQARPSSCVQDSSPSPPGLSPYPSRTRTGLPATDIGTGEERAGRSKAPSNIVILPFLVSKRQQIPEKSQKKKKKTKWRGDRATGTHKLQCVIL